MIIVIISETKRIEKKTIKENKIIKKKRKERKKHVNSLRKNTKVRDRHLQHQCAPRLNQATRADSNK